MAAISVVIPAKDAAATLGLTLESLVAQDFRDFEVVLIDDGSTDGTGAIAQAYADRLALRVLRHAAPQGVARSLNEGITAARAPLIARLDADDLARPDRLSTQLAYMQAHPEVDVCGSQMAVFSLDGGQVQASLMRHPADDAGIKTALVQYTALAHPSLIVRRGFYERLGGYDPRFEAAEDYELWTRGALAGARYANIEAPLSSYRRHAGQVGQARQQLQFERDLAVKRQYIGALLGGAPVGQAGEFLSLTCRFTSLEAAWAALPASLPALSALATRLPDAALYQQLLLGALQRHLR